MRFTKMHGLGNDYIYINGIKEKEQDWGALAQIMSPAHTGVASDGVIVILPSDKADFRMRMFNADGSEGEMCGNGIRCVGKYVYDYHLTDKTQLTIETLAGIKKLNLTVRNKKVQSVEVDMGISEVREPLTLRLKNGQTIQGIPVSMGNPHFVVFVNRVKGYDVAGVGSEIEKRPEFPNRTNVEFVEVVSPTHLKMRVWERGSGETMACGTGACASAVAAAVARNGSTVSCVELLGGRLDIALDVCFPSKEISVRMTGPATVVYDGKVSWEQLRQMRLYADRVRE